MRWPAQNKESKYTDTFLEKYMFGCVDILLTNQMALTEKQTLKPKPKRFDGNHSCLMHFGMFGIETTHAVVNSYITVVHRSFFLLSIEFSHFRLKTNQTKNMIGNILDLLGEKKIALYERCVYQHSRFHMLPYWLIVRTFLGKYFCEITWTFCYF